MLQFLKLVIDAIPHPVIWGCVSIAIGFIFAGFAGPIKVKADKKRNSRNVVRRVGAGKGVGSKHLTFACWNLKR
jgi:hypothetical protein